MNSYGLTPTTPSRWRVYLFHHLGIHRTPWQGRQDSNPRPAVLETAALPTELHPYATEFENKSSYVVNMLTNCEDIIEKKVGKFNVFLSVLMFPGESPRWCYRIIHWLFRLVNFSLKVPLGRFERPTRGLGNRCSIHLSYRGSKLGLVPYLLDYVPLWRNYPLQLHSLSRRCLLRFFYLLCLFFRFLCNNSSFC